MKLSYQGNFNSELLMDELLAAFPTWIKLGADGERTCQLGLQSAPDGSAVSLEVPEGSDIVAIKAVVDAHNGTKLTAAQQVAAVNAATLKTLRKPWAEWTAQEKDSFLRILAEQMGLLPQA